MRDVEPAILAADHRWVAGLAESLIADSRDALLVLDSDETVVGASPEWLVLCGGRLDQVLGRPFAEVVGAAQGSELADLLRRAQCERSTVEASISYRHPRGFALQLAARVTPIGAAGVAAGAHLVRLRPPSGPSG